MECRGEKDPGTEQQGQQDWVGQAVPPAQSSEPAGTGCMTRYPPAEPHSQLLITVKPICQQIV